jgi:DNA polymerase III delta prime subunit
MKDFLKMSYFHPQQWRFLVNSFNQNKIFHGYLFEGPENVGKTKFALEFTLFLNCERRENEKPCFQCQSCQLCLKNNHPDVKIIEVEPEKKEILIDQITKAKEGYFLSKNRSAFQVFIIKKAQLLNLYSQSAFLKILEEPLPGRIFIFLVDYPSKIFPTIKSRLQRLRFFPLTKEKLAKIFQKELKNPEFKKKIDFSFGLPALILKWQESEESFENLNNQLKELLKSFRMDLAEKFNVAKNLAQKNQEEIVEVLNFWLLSLHSQLIKKGVADFEMSLKLKTIIEKIQNAKILINFTNCNPRLVLENMMLASDYGN